SSFSSDNLVDRGLRVPNNDLFIDVLRSGSGTPLRPPEPRTEENRSGKKRNERKSSDLGHVTEALMQARLPHPFRLEVARWRSYGRAPRGHGVRRPADAFCFSRGTRLTSSRCASWHAWSQPLPP